MKIKIALPAQRILLSALGMCLAASAHTHNPADLDRMMMTPANPKSVPVTCEQLADSKHYSNDVANTEIQTLKETCDLEAAAASTVKEADKDANMDPAKAIPSKDE